MNNLRIVEVFYNAKRNKNYFLKRDGIVYDKEIIFPTSISINNLHPKYSFIVNNSRVLPYYNVRGTTRIDTIFEYAMRHECFRNIFNSREFLEIALNSENHTFFEDEWFIKAFKKLENYLDRYTRKSVLIRKKDFISIYSFNGKLYIEPMEKYTRISKDVDFMPVENHMTFKTLIKISKSFISKSTVSDLYDVFSDAFDTFENSVWEEYEHHNKLPF